MVFENIRLNIKVEDDQFNKIYPPHIRKIANVHWTPVEIAKQASQYLVDTPGRRVLDIGSGVGKFCVVGSLFTKGIFTGIEQRENLVKLSNAILKLHKLPNVNYIHSNITDVSFLNYDSFYFFNPFQENIDQEVSIDHKIDLQIPYYDLYTKYVCQQLDKAPKGARLVTYCSNWSEIPESFDLEHTDHKGRLNFWKKRV